MTHLAERDRERERDAGSGNRTSLSLYLYPSCFFFFFSFKFWSVCGNSVFRVALIHRINFFFFQLMYMLWLPCPSLSSGDNRDLLVLSVLSSSPVAIHHPIPEKHPLCPLRVWSEKKRRPILQQKTSHQYSISHIAMQISSYLFSEVLALHQDYHPKNDACQDPLLKKKHLHCLHVYK